MNVYLIDLTILRHCVDDELDAERAGEAERVGKQPEHSATHDERGVHGETGLQDPFLPHQTLHGLVICLNCILVIMMCSLLINHVYLVLHLGLLGLRQGAQVLLLERGAVAQPHQGDHPAEGHPRRERGLVVLVNL